jgi:hypothetical protein
VLLISTPAEPLKKKRDVGGWKQGYGLVSIVYPAIGILVRLSSWRKMWWVFCGILWHANTTVASQVRGNHHEKLD